MNEVCSRMKETV